MDTLRAVLNDEDGSDDDRRKGVCGGPLNDGIVGVIDPGGITLEGRKRYRAERGLGIVSLAAIERRPRPTPGQILRFERNGHDPAPIDH